MRRRQPDHHRDAGEDQHARIRASASGSGDEHDDRDREDRPGKRRDGDERGRRAAIYSSGSRLAQQLLFRHSVAGDLTPYLSGFYDTAVGPKRDANSYRAIAKDWGIAPERIYVKFINVGHGMWGWKGDVF